MRREHTIIIIDYRNFTSSCIQVAESCSKAHDCRLSVGIRMQLFTLTGWLRIAAKR
jgi:hypothetical protein